MTPAEAAEIADEQIAFWRSQGVTASEAWRAIGLRWSWGVERREVKLELVRSQLGNRWWQSRSLPARYRHAA